MNNHITTHHQRENRKKWVEALRSGNYKQGRKTLRQLNDGEDTYCCLGVACDVYDPQGWNMDTFYGMETALPGMVMNYFGLTDGEGNYGGPPGGNLAEHNDDDEWTFDQIADLIESEPKGMFDE